ncbi:branched-chain amino acid ABC transporter permease [Fimbriimonas ginsengisoli]|uniref:High-affinity branched-chain amino acid transport system permease n=1 Tax=Fimbriimonas ginsengisoli Gsoil 348 TaxID=661478 RepID=A0A068NVV5_FIMGI|nr:branched-chain amino acid ABC transporter permease [Fimbriimonas ginsengisoli]AIE87648.1 high-affinity branched-chain amino acid transport system permease [Fimbriimonas ginsengisoli Gsoil 348]
MGIEHLFTPAALNFGTLPEQLVNGLLLGAIYALIALGYTMVYGVLRLINFAHGEVYMIGAYVALFMSYLFGFGDGSTLADARPVLNPAMVGNLGIGLLVVGLVLVLIVRSKPDLHVAVKAMGWTALTFGLLGFVAGKLQPQAMDLILMLLACMTVCAIVGVLIERFAYRPMRSHSRIASLITAIGVSLLLQYGGALFLPNSPPPSISEKVNPYRESKTFFLKAPPAEIASALKAAEPKYLQTKKAFDDYRAAHPKEGEFDLSPEGKALRTAAQDAERPYQEAQSKAVTAGITITVQTSRIIMFVTVIVLMVILTYLVLYTRAGRAMRAVSHDFDSASLMGVNVNSIITFTFILGSSMAGAGAMMTATFQGTPLTTFYGLLPGVKAFVAAVLGGIGNIPGAVLGGILMGVAETLVIWAGYSNYKDAIAFVILIVVLLFRPGGLMGSSKVEKV